MSKSWTRLIRKLRSLVKSELAQTRLGYLGLASLDLSENRLYSQLGQDVLVNSFLHPEALTGTFVDVGAHDGKSFSNTYWLEKQFNWRGLCVEANPALYEMLVRNRSCIVENCAIGSTVGEGEFWQIHGYAEMLSGLNDTYPRRHRNRILLEVKQHGGSVNRIRVPIRPLSDLLKHHGLDTVDFLSVDTEGSELEVLKSIDFGRTFIRLVAVENPYRKNAIHRLLVKHDFVRLLRLGSDDIYIHTRHFFTQATSTT